MILITVKFCNKLNHNLLPRKSFMYVCLCKAVTDRQIKESIAGGACTFADVRRQLGVATQCGKCGQMAKSIVETAVKKASFEPAV